MFVYAIVCADTLKIYIGQHKGADLGKYFSKKWFDAHRYSDKRSHLYAAMRTYPRDSWSIHSLVSGVTTRIELDDLEKHFIRVLKSQHPDVGYNICDGGEGFCGPHSEETKKKISVAGIGRFQSEEKRKKLRDANLGKKATLATRERLRESHLGQPAWNKGRPMLPHVFEALQAGRAKTKPYVRTDALKKKMSERYKGQPGNWTGKHHSQETREKLRIVARQREERKRISGV